MVASLPNIRPVCIGAWREGSLATPVQRRSDVAVRPASTTTDEAMADAQRLGDQSLAGDVADVLDASRLATSPAELRCAPGAVEFKVAAKRQIPITSAANLRTAPRLACADRAEVGFADVRSEDRAKIANFNRLRDQAIEKVQRGRFL